jgi:serine/threonine protein kinase
LADHVSTCPDKDLKPSNILLTRDGTRLCGFGSALDYTLREDDLDDAGRGTPRYFAPETAEWLPSGRPADIFSLGCIFLEILTIHQKGSLKSLRENRSLIPPAFYASLDRVDTWLTGFSEPLLVESEVRAMLSRDPQNRPTAKDLVVKFALADAQRPNGALSMFKDCCRVSHIQPPQLKHHPSEATAKLEASLSVQSSTGQHYVKGVIDVEQPQVKPRQLHSCTSCWTRKFKVRISYCCVTKE